MNKNHPFLVLLLLPMLLATLACELFGTPLEMPEPDQAATPVVEVTPGCRQYIVTAVSAPLRDAPSLDAPVQQQLSQGDLLDVQTITASGDWLRIDDDSWIAASLVACAPAATATPEDTTATASPSPTTSPSATATALDVDTPTPEPTTLATPPPDSPTTAPLQIDTPTPRPTIIPAITATPIPIDTATPLPTIIIILTPTTAPTPSPTTDPLPIDTPTFEPPPDVTSEPIFETPTP